MRNKKYWAKAFSIFFIVLLNVNELPAQRKGDVVFGFSFGLVSKGIFSIKYFPVNGFAIELHGGVLPGFYNYGFALHNYFDLERPNTFIELGISNFGGMPEGVDMDSASADSVVSLGASNWGINMGLGREFVSGGDIYFFAGGPTYIFDRSVSYLNTRTREHFEEEEEMRWFGFVEFGISYYAKKKEQ
ncbi:MAG: hypothetical protein IPM56_18860 [Ignavibacteriales bacterium]|nr:MAG: hypothetical protein IPM56_18860 [Ignavibacteriales bacterium]